MGVRAFSRTATAFTVAAVMWLGASTATAFAAECANEARREEQNATYLPDCRAYEMVSPPEKKGSDIVGSNNVEQISDSGERAVFQAFSGFGETHGTGFDGWTTYVTKRGSEGWGTPFGVTPQPAKDDIQIVFGSTVMYLYSSSLQRALVESYQLANSTNPDIPHNENIYVENTDTGAVEAATTPVGVDPSEIERSAFEFSIRGASADLGVVAFENWESLMPGLPFGEKLYAFNHGKLEVAGVLPDGSLPAGGSGGATADASMDSERLAHTVSRDGTRVLFRSPTDGSKPAQLYMRRDGASTAWVSQSEASVPVGEPHVEYIDMAADGKVLFGSREPLTDSDPGGEGWGLYLYTDSPNPEAESNLTFVARTLFFGEAHGAYTAMSNDAKRVYFFSQATAGMPQTGTYLWDEGTLHFVAPTSFPITPRVDPRGTAGIGETTPDGSRLAFLVSQQLTEAPLGAPNGSPLQAMYLYDEASGSLTCVSCMPTGVPTASQATIWPEADHLVPNDLVATQARFLSEEGRYVFFSTADALAPGDVNGAEDVYEYDTDSGKVSLLSSGTGGQGTWFTDASPDGTNVLMVSREPYLAQDHDNLIDLYDARVGGGFREPPPFTGGCVGDECQGVPSAAPTFNTASGFTGLGNTVRVSGAGKAKSKGLTRGQKLARALRACRRSHGKARRRCQARARKRYGAHKASKSTSRASARR